VKAEAPALWWYDDRFYYSIVDIIAALGVSQKPPRQYWAQLKEQVRDEGFVEAKSRIVQIRLKAADGRLRKTDCADQETLLRLIQSIPSPRAEPIKQWLAKTGSEKIDEMALQRRPEAEFERMVQSYIERGYEPEWAWIRTQGDLVRNELTETIGISLHRKYETQGFAGLQSDAREAGEAGRKAREIAEGTLGEPVVSPENYLHLKRVRGDQKRSKKSLPQEPTLFNDDEEEKTQGK
jgi:hypothetical protein